MHQAQAAGQINLVIVNMPSLVIFGVSNPIIRILSLFSHILFRIAL